eukprot:gene11944-50886_t
MWAAGRPPRLLATSRVVPLRIVARLLPNGEAVRRGRIAADQQAARMALCRPWARLRSRLQTRLLADHAGLVVASIAALPGHPAYTAEFPGQPQFPEYAPVRAWLDAH